MTIPEGAEFDIDGLSPLITPNEDFYRVDTALTVPTVDPATWRLVIDGKVIEEQVRTRILDPFSIAPLDSYAADCIRLHAGD